MSTDITTTNGQTNARPLRSEEAGKIAEALAKAQKVLKHPVKSSDNEYFKSTYADINEVFEAGRVLADFGLAVTQPTTIDALGQMELITELIHTSGQWYRSYWPIRPLKPDPQTLAACTTYARRISYQTILGIAPKDGADDDGNRAAGHDTASQRDSAPRAPFPKAINGKPRPEAVPAPVAAVVAPVMARIVEAAVDAAEKPEDWGIERDWGSVVFDVPASVSDGKTLRQIEEKQPGRVNDLVSNPRWAGRIPEPLQRSMLNYVHQLDREKRAREAQPFDEGDGPSSDMAFELEE